MGPPGPQGVPGPIAEGGPFLALTGGTVSGPLTHGMYTVQGTPMTGAFTQNLNFSGANSATGIIGVNNWIVNSDNMAKTGNLLAHTMYNYNIGGAGYTGSRAVIVSNIVQTGAVTGGGVLEGVHSSIAMTNTWGGTDTKGGMQGGACTLNGYLAFQPGFINGSGGSAAELDIEAQAGSTFGTIAGLLITHTMAHGASGSSGQDYALVLNDQSGAVAARGWDCGLAFGASVWPMKTTASLIAAFPSSVTGYPANARHGIDLAAGVFSGYSFRGPGGFSVDANATMQVGTGYLSKTASGLSIDTTGSVATAVALVSGGSSWPTGGGLYYATDANGGIYSLTLASGVVTAVSFYNGQAPISKGAVPTNPVTLTPSGPAAAWGATGLTVNLTWAARTALTLQPSGGATSFGSGSQNVLTVTPGSAAGTGIKFQQSSSAGWFEFDGVLYVTSGGATDLSVATGISLGSAVAANGNTVIQTANGSNILLTPQGSAYVGVTSALRVQGSLGAFNTVPPASKPTVTGAKGSNAALASLLTALASYGLVTDSTTA
jgi:hypothetical protein